MAGNEFEITGCDGIYGDSASFEDIKDSLPDLHFYESGFNLPEPLKDLDIPPDPQQ